MADTRKLGELASAFARQAEQARKSTTDFVTVERGVEVRRTPAQEVARLEGLAAQARAGIDAENASPVAENSAYNDGRGYYDADGGFISQEAEKRQAEAQAAVYVSEEKAA